MPYATGFDHQQIADQVHFNFQRCMQRLEPPLQNLPVLGMGHSLGSLLQLLIGSRYPVQHAGKPASHPCMTLGRDHLAGLRLRALAYLAVLCN